MKESNEELAWVSTDDLVDEVLRRCEQGVVIFRRKTNDGQTEVVRSWHGELHTCIGLAADAGYFLMKSWERDAIPLK